MNTYPRRLALTAALLGCAALTLSACGGTTPPPPIAQGTDTAGEGTQVQPAGTGKSYNLGCTIPTLGHPFFVAMKKGLEEEAKAQGATLNLVDGKDDSQTQLTAMDNFVVKKVDAIILCPTETETLPPGVKKANGANIPVITVNRTVAGSDVVTYVGADDTEGGRLQGKALIEALPNGGKIILLQGVLGSSPQRNREAGLEEALKGHPGLEIVQRIPYDFQRAKAVEKMNTVLLQYPKGKIDAVVAQSDDGALAAADVCGQSGRTEITIIGFNGESDAFDQVRAGKIYATVLQDAETQGREAVKAALRHLKGESVPKEQITELFLVTKKNIDQYKPAWQSSSS
jgi:ribose transport system substrate-binding protein